MYIWYIHILNVYTEFIEQLPKADCASQNLFREAYVIGLFASGDDVVS